MKRRFKFFAAFPLSFGSASLYRDVFRLWKHVGILLVFLCAVIVSLPLMVKLQRDISRWNRSGELEVVLRQWPTVRIEGGALKTDVETPVFITDKDGKAIVIIDPQDTVKVTELDPNTFVLTSAEFVARTDRGQLRSIPYSNLGDREITADTLRSWSAAVATWAVPVVGVVLVSMFFIGRCLLWLILALVLWATNAAVQTGGFAAVLRITAVAMIPAAVLDAVLETARATFPFMWLVKLGITVGYLLFAASAITAQATSAPDSNTTAPPIG